MSVERYFSVETGMTFNSIAIEKLFDRIDRIGSRSRTAVSKSMPVKPIAASPQKLMHNLSGWARLARVEGQSGIPDRRQIDRHILVDRVGIERRVGDLLSLRHRGGEAAAGKAAADAEDEVAGLQHVPQVLADADAARAQ